MQNFIDTATQQPWSFDGDVKVTSASGVYSFADANGSALSAPTTLQPYTPPVQPTVDVAWQVYRGKALAALQDSDVTVLRCIENSVSVPSEWVAYRNALRAIVSAESGDATQPLPARPGYPSGT